MKCTRRFPPSACRPVSTIRVRVALPLAAALVLTLAVLDHHPAHAATQQIECTDREDTAQAFAQQITDATDAQLGASNPKPRSERCRENAGVTPHATGAEPTENVIEQVSNRRWKDRGIQRQSNRQRPRVSVEEVESVEQDLRWARRALDRGEPDRAFRIISRVVDRAPRVPEDEAAEAFDLLARIGDAHMAADEADSAATAYAALVELGDHLDDDAATAAATRLRSATD